MERKTTLAYFDEYPVSPGHTLIVPRRHVMQLFDLRQDELCDAWDLIQATRRRLVQEDSQIAGFNIGANIGVTAGQTVAHAHIHVIPRRRGDTPDPRGGVRAVIPARMRYQVSDGA